MRTVRTRSDRSRPRERDRATSVSRAPMRTIAVREPSASFAAGEAASARLGPPAATRPVSPIPPTIVASARSSPAVSPAAPASPSELARAGAVGPTPARSFHGAVSAFKRRLIETTLTELGGNRTRTARVLGLQRTYLLRLMREFEVHVPAATGHPRRAPGEPAAPP